MIQRILVAEDETVVAFDLCETVKEAGYEVLGPHSGISDAMLAFQIEKPDLAILDVELLDGLVFSFAQTLTQENVPLIFHTGSHSAEEVAAQFPRAVTLAKPCPPAQVLQAVNEALDDQNVTAS